MFNANINKFVRHAGLFMVTAMLIGLFAGCAQSNKGAAADQPKTAEQPAAKKTVEKHDPITLRISDNNFTEDQKKYLSDSVKKKYPYITMQFEKTDYVQMTAAGTLPDIVFSNFIKMNDVLNLDIAEDLTSYVKAANIDLKRFEDYVFAQPVILNNGKLFALPYYTNFSALYYNKDIFDKFGVPYPKDGMTWDDAIELGKKVTREDGGTQYYGLGITPERVAYSLPALQIDGKTSKATMNTESWKTIFNLLNANWSIPGMKKPGDKSFPNMETMFSKDRNVAMIPGQSYVLRGLEEAASAGFNFDIVQLPAHKSAPNTYEWDNTAVLSISKTSKLKDDAIKVIGIIGSDEYQTWITEHGQLTALKKLDIKLKYGQAMPFLKGKNIAGIFKSHAATPLPISPYYNQTRKYIDKAMADSIYNEKDINTALREADENINKEVETIRAK